MSSIDPQHSADSAVFFGNVDWWYHNRGHSSCRTAIRIARRVPTLWVNSIGMRMPVMGRTDIAGSRYWRKFKSLLKGLRRDRQAGMWVYSPLFVPRYGPGWIELNGRLVAWQVRMVRRMLAMRNPAAWISMPTFTPAIERTRWHRAVFDRCDDFSTLPEADAPIIAALERRLLDRCDAVAYVNDELFERERATVRQPVLLGHGVDFELFASARPLDGPAGEAPQAMRHLPRPIVGFYGGIDDYRMDMELMVKVARHVAPGSFVLIGPAQMDLSRLLREPNAHHLGQLPPEQLPRYAAHFDVGLIPFLVNDFNRRCNPIKLKEYLALAFPIVATRLPAYEPYGDCIYLAQGHEQFLQQVDAALAERPADGLGRRRRAAVAGDSWDTIADRAARLMDLASIHPAPAVAQPPIAAAAPPDPGSSGASDAARSTPSAAH